jgi:rod shape-determining protein MreD
MQRVSGINYLLIGSFILSFMLDIIPLPGNFIFLRPEFTLVVLIYWVLYLPRDYNIGLGFIVGIFLDLLSGTVLGEHAIIFVLISYFLALFHRQIRFYSVAQQMLMILGLIVFDKTILLAMGHFSGEKVPLFFYLLSILVSWGVWFLVEFYLDSIRHRKKTYA